MAWVASGPLPCFEFCTVAHGSYDHAFIRMIHDGSLVGRIAICANGDRAVDVFCFEVD